MAVVHPLPDMAEKALSLIKAEYELPAATVDDRNIYERIVNTAARDNVIEQKGDLALGKKLAVLTVRGILSHALCCACALPKRTARLPM